MDLKSLLLKSGSLRKYLSGLVWSLKWGLRGRLASQLRI